MISKNKAKYLCSRANSRKGSFWRPISEAEHLNDPACGLGRLTAHHSLVAFRAPFEDYCLNTRSSGSNQQGAVTEKKSLAMPADLVGNPCTTSFTRVRGN